EKADITKLLETGIRLPEPFVAKGRDGVTDIYGIIVRPMNFDPSKKYPVIENIYAGPHSSFVPKSFRPIISGMHQLAELGFIVVQIDGMGTSNRSKTFHDVCWKNLKDAGLPDRILWIKAAARKYPYMDTTRVGIYGTSAGGQNAAAAVLFHPEFYKVAVAACGCHDNRMDKMWWNEQFMGWPVGPEYAESSNVENAWRLQGKLMLINSEMDKNVDPSSTVQFVDALIKAGKEFEYVFIPGAGHSSGGPYGERKRRDFFVKNLLGVNPPDWNNTPN
ncbi:MAG TPA: S9 family peptidase, partial [Bacteroidales bacterium]|nr:S9 family peptidase [Bacteroidales bacterium]